MLLEHCDFSFHRGPTISEGQIRCLDISRFVFDMHVTSSDISRILPLRDTEASAGGSEEFEEHSAGEMRFEKVVCFHMCIQ